MDEKELLKREKIVGVKEAMISQALEQNDLEHVAFLLRNHVVEKIFDEEKEEQKENEQDNEKAQILYENLKEQIINLAQETIGKRIPVDWTAMTETDKKTMIFTFIQPQDLNFIGTYRATGLGTVVTINPHLIEKHNLRLNSYWNSQSVPTYKIIFNNDQLGGFNLVYHATPDEIWKCVENDKLGHKNISPTLYPREPIYKKI